MKFLTVICAVLAVTSSLPAPDADDNAVSQLTPAEKLMGFFNEIDRDLKDVVTIMDIVNDLAKMATGYERTCVLQKLKITEDNRDLFMEDVSEKETLQVASAIILCLPDTETKMVQLFKKVAPLVKKYAIEEEDEDVKVRIQCARKLAGHNDVDCSDDGLENMEGFAEGLETVVNQINNEIDKDCPVIDDAGEFKKNLIDFVVLTLGSDTEEIKDTEFKRLYRVAMKRLEDYLQCSLK
jgi:hypothetical protein